MPWYTYPAVDFLRAKDLRGYRVLEFGAGQSTMWWAAHGCEVLALEDDPTWCAELATRLPANARLRRVPPGPAAMADALSNEAPFDIVIVDGLDRFYAAKLALQLLAQQGAILLDNSEGYWGPPPSYPIIDLFRTAGFLRIDFYGHAPGVVLPHCTSLFYRSDCRLLRGNEDPVRYKQ